MRRQCGMASRETRRWVQSGLVAVVLVSFLAITMDSGCSVRMVCASPLMSHLPPPAATISTDVPTTTAASSSSTLSPPLHSTFVPAVPVPVAAPPQSEDKISESVVISTALDAEKNAQDMYKKNLMEAGSFSASERCDAWKQRGCQCTSSEGQLTLLCRDVGMAEVPPDMPVEIVKLDLGNNNITQLYNNAFETVPELEELVLSDNSIARIDADAFAGLQHIKRLSLHNCGLTVIPGEALKRIRGLHTLQLDANAITSLDANSLLELRTLRTLRLEGNMLTRVPTEALVGLVTLEALNLGSNHMFSIAEGDFPEMENLNYLLLKRNRIAEVANNSIGVLTKLKVLDLAENLLTVVPVGLDRLTQLQELYLSGNKIKWISKNDLPRNVITLELKANPLVGIRAGALQNMPRLRKLVLSDARNLRDLPSLEGCVMLEILRMDRSSLASLPSDICLNSPRLRSLELKSNKLRSIPDLTSCKDLRMLDLSGNRVDSMHGKPFKGLSQLHDLLLSHNEIASIPFDAFHGIPKLQSLDLEGNRIGFIHDDAFATFMQLEDLNLGNNVFPTLPKVGMHRILHLKTFNNPKLREFPPPETFPRIQTLVLSYAYHCCPFLPLVTMGAQRKEQSPLEQIFFLKNDNDFDMSLWNNSQTDIWPQLHNLSKKFGSQFNDIWDSFDKDFTYPSNLPVYMEEYFEMETVPNRPYASADMSPGTVQCLPLPGPFLPCQDLFDWWTLRCGVWVVFLMAMLGNGTVVFVLIFSRSKMDVPRFLVCNLAAADFFMGIYLGMLAVVDASTLGEFRMYAIPWQMSVGCQMSGFLAVLSAELSVYTLAVITLERNYAITHAMHLNKRLSLRHAAYIMVVGWLFSLTMAMLPLFGISDYRKFAVCLPFETTNGAASLFYVVFLMFINGVAFLILMGCYLKMYCAIRGSQAWNSNDSRIAKRMALLVFTDFICWSPIAFLSLTAVFGLHLISLEQAKVFTVFVLPLNSCCNPFLYAIMTKQFKKDCVLICKAIEESRVTRGIGRCRHSSNFSNRQTPANTNSLAERSSKELPPLMPGHTCACAKLLEQELPRNQIEPSAGLLSRAWGRIICKHTKRSENRRDTRSDQYAYQIAEIQQKQYKRAGSVSSENFSSSRSDSWRHGPPHHCGIPLRILDPRRRHSSWLVTRKTSQDSNLSSSRNDSSASATTASTSTFRMSRSSASSSTPMQPSIGGAKPSIGGVSGGSCSMNTKPRLVRQQAVQEETTELSSSPPRLGVRFLPTIPSAADSSVILDEESSYHEAVVAAASSVTSVASAPCSSSLVVHPTVTTPFYTVLQSGNTLTTLSSPNTIHKHPP